MSSQNVKSEWMMIVLFKDEMQIPSSFFLNYLGLCQYKAFYKSIISCIFKCNT